jgi:hypothetical protein
MMINFILGNSHSPRVSRISSYLVLLLLAVFAILAGCTGSQNQSGSPTPAPAGGTMPGLAIISPVNGSILPAGDITVSVQVSNFKLVPKNGQPYKAGEGHLHYSIGIITKAAASSSEIAQVTVVSTTDTNFIWRDVPPGTYTFTVELINNDHTPFATPIIRSVTVTVIERGTPTTP